MQDKQKRQTASQISMRLREMAGQSLLNKGGVKYLERIADEDPQAYLQFLSKMVKADDGAEAAGITFVVQQLVMHAQPVPGVSNSPVVEHIAAPLKLIGHG